MSHKKILKHIFIPLMFLSIIATSGCGFYDSRLQEYSSSPELVGKVKALNKSYFSLTDFMEVNQIKSVSVEISFLDYIESMWAERLKPSIRSWKIRYVLENGSGNFIVISRHNDNPDISMSDKKLLNDAQKELEKMLAVFDAHMLPVTTSIVPDDGSKMYIKRETIGSGVKYDLVFPKYNLRKIISLSSNELLTSIEDVFYKSGKLFSSEQIEIHEENSLNYITNIHLTKPIKDGKTRYMECLIDYDYSSNQLPLKQITINASGYFEPKQQEHPKQLIFKFSL